MAAWELALIIVAVTFMMVNLFGVIVQLMYLIAIKKVFTRSIKILNKTMKYSEKAIEEFFEEME